MPVTVHSDKVHELVDATADVEQVATGFTFTEGPIWMPDGSLHFSDMPADKRRRWHPEEGVTVLRDPSNKCNGMTLDNDGNLIVCEHVTSSVVRERPDGARETLATHYGGRELNSPNDVIVASDGSILFTDPTYGRMPGFGLEREQELDFQGVYRIPPGRRRPAAARRRLRRSRTGSASRPTSRCSTSNDTDRAHIRVFDVGPDHALSNGRVLAEGIGTGDMATGELVDGMKLDELGNIYVTGPKGVWIISPEGEHARRDRGAGERRQRQLGRRRLAHALHPGVDLGVPDPAEGRRQPARLHALTTRGGDERWTRSTRKRAALVIQDLQNDVIIEGGAFADSGAPAHATSQNVVENVKAASPRHCRSAGVPVIHVWYIVEAGAPGLKQNAPLFEGVKDANALVRGTWGAAPADGLEPQAGDHIVEKMRMNAFYETRLDMLLRGLGVETLIITGAWTNMSIEHTARHAADAGYRAVVASGRHLDGGRRVAARRADVRDDERRHGGDVRGDRVPRWKLSCA